MKFGECKDGLPFVDSKRLDLAECVVYRLQYDDLGRWANFPHHHGTCAALPVLSNSTKIVTVLAAGQFLDVADALLFNTLVDPYIFVVNQLLENFQFVTIFCLVSSVASKPA